MSKETFQEYLTGNSQTLQIPGETYRRILQKAVDQTRVDIPQVDSAFAANDMETIQSISHRWKGDYDNLRLGPLAQTARDLNIEAKGNKDQTLMATNFDKFKLHFNELCQKLDDN